MAVEVILSCRDDDLTWAVAPSFAIATFTSGAWERLTQGAIWASTAGGLYSRRRPERGGHHHDPALHRYLVPVMDGDRAVGVVLMTDVFDSVAQYIMEKGARRPGEPSPQPR